jgi:prepilin-type N-terminal cleavage/methylation domain-containing protein
MRWAVFSSAARPRIAANPGNAARPRAFTLIEVLLSLVILSVVVSVFWMSYDGMRHQEDLPESVRRIRSAVAMCRAKAMEEGRRYRMRIHRDGTIDLTRQLDPMIAPHLFGHIRNDWAYEALLLDDVWVESVQPMPDGPPPIGVVDDQLELTKYDIEEPIAVGELEAPLEIWFEPDGTSTSARWTLRHAAGPAIRMLLDGRVGRITTDQPPETDKDDRKPERPQAISAEEKTVGIVENEAEALNQARKGE